MSFYDSGLPAIPKAPSVPSLKDYLEQRGVTWAAGVWDWVAESARAGAAQRCLGKKPSTR